MLSSLSVKNVVLIDKLDLDFSSGLTVFTGETGAGKSILLDSLSLALGMRAETGLVRYGEKEAVVSACFTLPMDHPIKDLLSEHGYDYSGEVILKRTLSCDGRSRAFINDEPVSVGFLKMVGNMLVEIHGQFASYQLLDPSTHLGTLDAYGHLTDDVKMCQQAFQNWQDKKKKRLEMEENLAKSQQDEEFLRASISDLEKLNPTQGEEETLSARRTALMNSEKIITSLNEASDLLTNEASGCVSILGRVLSQLERANQWAEQGLSSVVDQISEALTLINDSAETLSLEQEKWGDISELPQIDDRLFSLRDMARKHKVSISELPDLLQRLRKQIATLETGTNDLAALQKEEEKARLSYIEVAENLSRKRKAAAQKLDQAVAQELPSLKLTQAVFKTEIKKSPESEWNGYGLDDVSFQVATNKGMPLSPIHKVASGGELTRFMLALKVNLAGANVVETLIFDEIDTGVSGATASRVGDRLAQLGKTHQVLVITHSPQVAGYGQAHLKVQKQETENHTITTVQVLNDTERLDEIARLLSGEVITQKSKEAAAELLKA